MKNLSIFVTDINSVPLFEKYHPNHIISIGDEENFPALGLIRKSDFNLYRFNFIDISHEEIGGPTRDHVKRIIKISRDILSDEEDARVLFHCHAGISRSTMAAIIFLLVAGFSYERAYDEVKKARGYLINPNELMAKYADELLGYNGELKAFITKMHIH